MGSALLNTTTDQEFAVDSGLIASPTLRRVAKDGAPELRADAASPDALRLQVAERLAAHRRRRGSTGVSAATARLAEPVRSASTRSARIAATVAERYSHTPSYRAFLAAEAERAVEQARAAAEVAAMNAQAIADAQQRMLNAFDEAAIERAAAQEESVAANVRPIEDLRAAQDKVHHEDKNDAMTTPQVYAVEQTLWPDVVHEEPTRVRGDSTRIGAPDLRMDRAGQQLAKAVTASAVRAAGLTVRLYEDGAGAAHGYRSVAQRAASLGQTNRREYRNEAEAMALDEEIAFRQAPVFEEPVGPPVPLPANLIEFPRQLVASRKARPRLAEGPLREEADAAPGDGQLRIFEVDAAQISTQPVEVNFDTPQWSSIWLDTPPEAAAIEGDAEVEQWQDQAGDAIASPVDRSIPAVQAASIARRVTAAGIDLCIVVAGALAFAATSLGIFSRVMASSISLPEGGSLLQNLRLLAASIAAQTGLEPGQFGLVAAVVGVSLILLYQGLFFWFSDVTPGMRMARIGLCTFDDENPTRRAIRRRLGAMLLSACVLGFGFMWALLDEDRLTWHDRITHMYLRSY